MSKMLTFTANLSGKIRHESLNGEDYYVAPVVLITEGVHRGSNGAHLYLKEDLVRSVPAWNSKPITIGHPKNEAGNFISAGTADVIEKVGVGFLLNTSYDNAKNKLRSEAWIRKSRATSVDPRLEEALLNNKITEVSTGLFSDLNVTANQQWNGTPVDGVAINHQPDHLAILFDEVGACSVKAGAGLLQVNQAEADGTTQQYQRLMASVNMLLLNELGLDGMRSMLTQALRSQYGDELWIEEVYPKSGTIIFSDLQGGLFSLMYKIDKKGTTVSFVQPMKNVRRVISYEELTVNSAGTAQTKEGITPMDKTARQSAVTKMIRNSQWTEASRQSLVDMDDATFEQVRINTINTNSEPVVKPAEVVAPVKPAATLEEAVEGLPEQFKGVVANALQHAAATRTALIASITANANNKIPAESLEAMSTEVLESIKESIAPVAAPEAVKKPANFAGAVPTANTGGAKKVEGLALPAMSFSK